MHFSTRAEYGVRLMIELGRQAGEGPTPLNAIADAENLPLAYLERLVALLRKAGLVTSTRGAHGGYELALPAEEITLDLVIEALEGPIAPMDCLGADDRMRVACSHEGDAGRACATRLMWMRVQGGMLDAMRRTTLAELVEFSRGHDRMPAASRMPIAAAGA